MLLDVQRKNSCLIKHWCSFGQRAYERTLIRPAERLASEGKMVVDYYCFCVVDAGIVDASMVINLLFMAAVASHVGCD